MLCPPFLMQFSKFALPHFFIFYTQQPFYHPTTFFGHQVATWQPLKIVIEILAFLLSTWLTILTIRPAAELGPAAAAARPFSEFRKLRFKPILNSSRGFLLFRFADFCSPFLFNVKTLRLFFWLDYLLYVCSL